MSNIYFVLLQKKENELSALNQFLDRLTIEEYYEYEYSLFIQKTNDYNFPFISFYPSKLKNIENEIRELKIKCQKKELY